MMWEFQMLTIAEALAHGLRLHNAGRIAEAAKFYRQVLESAPNHPDALHLLGVVHGQSGRHDQAIALLERAIQIQPSSAAFHADLGMALVGLGRHDQAVASYRLALKLDPLSAAAHHNLGVALMELGSLDDAAECYRRAIAIKPDYADAFHNLAVVTGGNLAPEELAAANHLLTRPLPLQEQAFLQFGLAHVLDAHEEYERAAEHAENANRNQRRSLEQRGIVYNPAAYEAHVDQMMTVFTNEFLDAIICVSVVCTCSSRKPA
jgi:Tfp pilus assembly protein PilF